MGSSCCHKACTQASQLHATGIDVTDLITDNIYLYGRVYATCYWNGNGEDCDGPLCHRMVFGFQGSAYYADEALSYSGGPSYNGGPDWCDYGFRTAREGAKTPAARETVNGNNTATTAPAPAAAPGATRGQGRSRVRGAARHAPRAGAHGAGARTRGPRPAAAHAMAQTAQVGAGMQYNHKDSHSFTTDRPVYYGEAYVVNGIVFGLSGQTKEKWQSGGTFEWTMDFYAYGLATEEAGFDSTGVQAGLPWVTDKEMKIVFWKEPSYYSSSSQK